MRNCVSFLLLLLVPMGLSAQSTNASIAGQVLDSSGSSVPAAKVIARNLETGIASELESSVDGLFNFPALTVGRYEVAVEAAGFQRFVQTGITLEVNRNATLKIMLQAGSVSES